jgi:formylglycine-generating enzyme required for sulfatase activity
MGSNPSHFKGDMNIKLIEVETGETLQSASDKYSSMNDLIDHSQELVSRLIGVEVAVSRSESEGRSVEKPAQKETIAKSTIDSLGMVFVLVEGGTFQMGDMAGGGEETPVHSVTVSSFYLGKYEVTQRQWVALMGSNPSHFKGDNLPVEQVSWFEAVEFCNRLSVKEGLQPCYTISGTSVSCDFSKNGYRLPTEAEWEYAAKGGRSSRGYRYAGGNDVGAVGWYYGNSGWTTHAVGGKQANELGLYDMSGNVLEWCWDWYRGYSGGSQTDPRGPSSGQYRLLRGGSWGGSDGSSLRASLRAWYVPGYRVSSFGFRLARPRT